MDAIIRGRLCLSESDMEELYAHPDKWFKAWGQVKYYLENIERVEFT